MKYDVVVAGGGTAGLFAAYRLASSGLSVAVVELKSAEKIGEKVCGDAVGEHHFIKVGLEPPRLGVDAVSLFKGVRVYSPNEKAYVTAWGKGYAIDRKAFGQRLLRLAVNAGAELLDSHRILEPIVDGKWVKGIVAEKMGAGRFELYSKVVVEATGAAAAVRTKLPSEWWVSEKVPLEDFNIAYRVIAEVEEPQDTGLALIYLNPDVAPGGYWWWFPKGEHVVNVGLGVKPGPSAPNPRDQFRKYILPLIEKAGGRILNEGAGLCPTRRTISCMVWNGLVAVGDAAATANPIHGGGIGPSLLSSYYASEVVVEALDRGEASMENLWRYHKAYHETYGIKQAGLDALRIYLQSLSSDDLNFILEKGIVSDEELSEMGYKGELLPSIISKALKAVKLLTKPSILFDIKAAKGYLDKARKLFEEFPEKPEGFSEWENRNKALFREIKERFWSHDVGGFQGSKPSPKLYIR